MSHRLCGGIASLVLTCLGNSALLPVAESSAHSLSPRRARCLEDDEPRFEFCGEFDPGHGGCYGLALNADGTRLFVLGESSWLDILDVTAPGAIRSVAQQQFEGLPYGRDGKYGVDYDPHFQRLALGGGVGKKIFLIDVQSDQATLLDAVYPPEAQFLRTEFPPLLTTPPLFIKNGSAIAAAMQTGAHLDDPSSGEILYFGEGVYFLSIDPTTHKISVADEGIGGLSTHYGQCYDRSRDLLWCGGRDGAEAVVDLSQDFPDRYFYWSCCSGDWASRVMPDIVTRDGKWLIERVASLFPPDHWFIRIRQIKAVDGSYSCWGADMPTDGNPPQLMGSPIDWNGMAENPGSRISSQQLLPGVLTHDETRLITAEAEGNELLILDLTDKSVEPSLLFTKSLGEGEEIQSIQGHRNRFYVSLKSGRIVVYEWDFVQNPDPPIDVSAVVSSTDQAIALSWSPPSSGVPPAGYHVYRKTTSDPFRQIASVSETAWTDGSIAEDTAYTYTVRSFAPLYGPLESTDAQETEVTSPAGIPPRKVTDLSAATTLGGVALLWKANSELDIVGYFVYRKTGDTPFVKITPLPLTQPHYYDLDVDEMAEYSYHVTAVDARLEGASSEPVTLAAGNCSPNLLLNPDAEEQAAGHWLNAATTFPPDPFNRYSFDNDLFIGVTSAFESERGWVFWADRTSGRCDRLTYNIVDEPYFLAAYQDVDVSLFGDAIDSPEEDIVADWGGQLISVNHAETVRPSIAIDFLDSDGIVLEKHELRCQTVDAWVPLSSSNSMPPGTRSVRFWMVVDEVNASPANAAWDDLSLVLRRELPHVPLSVVVVPGPSGFTISFGPTVLGSSYQVEYADALTPEANSWKPCGPPFDGNGDTLQWNDSPTEEIDPTDPPVSDAAHRFYRIRRQ